MRTGLASPDRPAMVPGSHRVPMPEALAVLFVVAVCVVIYVAAWLRGRDPALVNAHEDLQRLRHHEAWLHERLHRAQLERWDADMIAGLADELRATSRQLARATTAPDRPR